jgi:hypothetical protein
VVVALFAAEVLSGAAAVSCSDMAASPSSPDASIGADAAANDVQADADAGRGDAPAMEEVTDATIEAAADAGPPADAPEGNVADSPIEGEAGDADGDADADAYGDAALEAGPEASADADASEEADAVVETDGDSGDGEAGPEAGDAGPTTSQALADRGAGCLSCAISNGCLAVATDGNTCEMLGDAQSVTACVGLLECILGASCVDPYGGVLSCLCGGEDASVCGASTAPQGPCATQYLVAAEAMSLSELLEYLYDPTTAAGGAGNIAACLAAGPPTPCPSCL